jgi:glycosyltransferase involved in cell wall biosynthesis
MAVVAVLFEHPTLLGGERSWLATAAAHREAGFLPLAIAPAGGPLADALAASGIEQAAWSVRGSRGRRELPALREELRRLLVDLSPALVHANSLSMTRLAAPVCRDLGVPILGHIRDIVRLSAAAVHDVNLADRLLAVSEATRRFHVAQGVDAERVHVVYNGVNLLEFGPLCGIPKVGLAEELALSNAARLVITIGQIGMRKGTDIFVELAGCVLRQRSDVHFLIVGERTSGKVEAARFEIDVLEKASRPPCRGHVHLLGTRSDVAQILAQVDIVVHAARQEPLGRVLLESAASARAIVATDVGGTREIFPASSRAALVVPKCEPGEVAASELLAGALRLLVDDAARAALGQAARRRAEEQFDARESERRLVRHLRELVD